jgi:RHS repeat-associated protein
MAHRHQSPRLGTKRSIPCTLPLRRAHRYEAFFWITLLPLIILSGILLNWTLLMPAAFATPAASYSAPGHNTLQQFLHLGQRSKAYHGPLVRPPVQTTSQTGASPKSPPSAEPPTMKPITQALTNMQTNAAMVGATSVQPLDLTGSDGRLEVRVSPGAFDLSHALTTQGAAPSGVLTLRISQVHGHAISSFNVLGAYQIQVLDSQGNALSKVALRVPLTLIYHYQPWEMSALDLDPNQIFLSWPGLIAAAQAAHRASISDVTLFTNNARTHTLTAQTSVIDGASSLTIGSQPDNQAPPVPRLVSVQGNSGNLSYSYAIQMAPAPGGFTPALQLTYSSGDPNGRHGQSASASAAGDGWSISLGSITSSVQTNPNGSGTTTWYFISGIDNISDRLIPDVDNSGFYLTEHLSHLRIFKTSMNGHPCFQVWDTSGNTYNLGCTADSLQYYTNANGRTDYRWDVDRVNMANEGPGTTFPQINVHYFQDILTSNGYTRVRDSGIEQVQYGSGPLDDSTFTVAGTIDFHYHAPPNAVSSSNTDGLGNPWAIAYPTNYNCASTPPTSTTARCDVSIDDGSVQAPMVRSTLTLDSITSFVGPDTSTSNIDYQYVLSYNKDVPFFSCQDPYTLVNLYCAGEHTLASITPTAYLQGTPHPQKPMVFTYTQLQNSYYDSSTENSNSSAHFKGQTTWQYLASYQDQQTGVGEKISYATAWNNTHGTPNTTNSQGQITDDRHDPLYCTLYTTCTDSYAHPNDKAWTVQVVTSVQNRGSDSSGVPAATTSYQYQLPVTGSACPSAGSDTDCVGDTWQPSKDANWADYYDSEFMGFSAVYITSPAGDLTVDHYPSNHGWGSSASDPINYLSSQLLDEEVYSGNSTSGPLLQKTVNAYAGESGSGTSSACDSDASLEDYTPCEAVLLSTRVTTNEGATSSIPWLERDYTYDDYTPSGGLQEGSGHYHNMTQETISGSNLNTNVYPLTKKWTYSGSGSDQKVNGWVYYTVNKVVESETDDSSGHIWQCTTTSYDEGEQSGIPSPAAGLPTTVKTYSSANCASQSNPLTITYTSYDANENVVATVDGVGAANTSVYASTGCQLASTPVIMSKNWPNTRYTTCTTYDSYLAQPVTQTNVLGQATATTYDPTQQDQPTSVIDLNGQTTTTLYSYDSNGNSTVQQKAPLETGSYTSQSTRYSSCTASSTLPCFEIDTNDSLYSNATSRTFYDSQGRAVETRTPGPTPGDETVVITVYNDQNHTKWQSVPFQVASGTTWLDKTTAKDINGNTPSGTVTFYDALDRVIAAQDPNYGSAQEQGLFCSWGSSGTYTSCINYSLTGGSSSMDEETDIDANGHVVQKQMDALGHVIYVNTYSGAQQNVVEQQTQTLYNVLDKPFYVAVSDDHAQSGQTTTTVTTHLTYDDLGRLLSITDPDQGTLTYSYDQNSNLSTVVQTSGSSSRTLGYNYDLLGRMTCEQTAAPVFNATGACSAGSPLLQNTYDTTLLGTKGATDFPVGQLTQSIATTYYPDSTSAKVAEQFQHDQRGRLSNEQVSLTLPSGWNVTSLPSYQETMLYNDADQVTTTSTTGSGGYTFTNVYNPTNGVLQGLSNNGNSTANLASLSYNEYAQLGSITQLNGAAPSPTSLASETFNYDANLRPTSLSATWLPGSGNSGQILGQSRTYDNASNVTGVATTFASVPGQSGSGGSETQNFCYDEQNRLIWAGNTGTQPGTGNGTCGSGALSSGLSGASYNAAYIYTNLGQIWQGPQNGQGAAVQYLYCDSSHPHQLTGLYPAGTTCATKGSATASYAASYDPWGNETSRTYNSVTATLSYDALNRLTEYSASTGQEFYLYDASGSRIFKRSISGGSTTLAVYLFGLEEYDYTSSGTLTSQLHYYTLSGHLIGSFDGSHTTFYLTDALGSVLLSFSQSAILGEQVYGPYGNSRDQVGSINTPKGYTGQIHDAVTGLDYYNARYYDPVVGLFLSVDSVQGNQQGMNPYAYVRGNPETMSDPTGLWGWLDTLAVAVVAVAVVAAAVVVAPAVAAVVISVALPTIAESTAAYGAAITAAAVWTGVSAGGGAAASIVADTAASGGNPDPGQLLRDGLVQTGIGTVEGAFNSTPLGVPTAILGIAGQVGYAGYSGYQSYDQSQQQNAAIRQQGNAQGANARATYDAQQSYNALTPSVVDQLRKTSEGISYLNAVSGGVKRLNERAVQTGNAHKWWGFGSQTAFDQQAAVVAQPVKQPQNSPVLHGSRGGSLHM